MGKINKRIKTKAKTVIARVANEFQTTNKIVKKKLIKKSDESKEKLLLHRTISSPKKTISKKEKFRQKHKNLLNKFAVIKKQHKEEVARKNREKAAITGDLKPLKDALPALDELLKLSKEKRDIKTGIKEYDAEESQTLNVKQKLKKKKTKFITQVNSYQALLKDPDFKKNPRDVISYHIKYTHGFIDE